MVCIYLGLGKCFVRNDMDLQAARFSGSPTVCIDCEDGATQVSYLHLAGIVSTPLLNSNNMHFKTRRVFHSSKAALSVKHLAAF
jgi:hypothetical protein